MTGQVVCVTPADSIRIETDGAAVQLPALLLLSIDAVLRKCTEEGALLVVAPQRDGLGWKANAAGYEGKGWTAWGAVDALGKKMEKAI